MSSSVRAFRIGLYEEHLAEAGFLYEARRAAFRDPEVPWPRLRDFEDRLDAHVDGLAVGGALARELCLARIGGDEAGELYAIALLACHTLDAALLSEISTRVDPANRAKVRAVTDALHIALPPAWRPFSERALETGAAALRPILAEVLAYQRHPCGPAVLRWAESQTDPAPRLSWALGRLRESAAVDFLRRQCKSASPAPGAREAALIALARIGDPAVIGAAGTLALAEPALGPVIGLVGDAGTARGLRDLVQERGASIGACTALGLLGELSCVRLLVAALAVDDTAAGAAGALELITGAGLRDDVFLPDPPDPAEWTPAERQAHTDTGAIPGRPDGVPYGRNVTQPSTDPARWTQWLSENAARFDRGLRYRRGRPYAPEVLIEQLLDETADKPLRALACEELAIRYQADVPIEADMPVAQQRRAIAALSAWAARTPDRFEPGRWHFAGREQG